MSKHITFFDPRAIDPGFPNGRENTVTANNAEEYATHRAAILDPARRITLIDPLELPEVPEPEWFTPEIDPVQQNRADIDYIAIMTGVEL